MRYDRFMASPRPEPVELHVHAMDNLRYIRRTMERAGSFTAVPGMGGMLMGSVALVAAGWPPHQPGRLRWLAGGLAGGGVGRRAHRHGGRGAEIAARRIAAVFRAGAQVRRRVCPAMVAGALLTVVSVPRRHAPDLSGHLAAALRRRRGFRRLGIGPRGAADGRLLHGGGGGGAAGCRFRAICCWRRASAACTLFSEPLIAVKYGG